MIEPEIHEDKRGFFLRSWCQQEFADAGLASTVSQANISQNKRCGTIRGLHYQEHPHEETKVVRCVRGGIWDVVVDLRLSSPTYRNWIGEELTAANCRALYVPAGCAHGFQTLEDDTEVHYLMSEPYSPESARGARYDDGAFDIQWRHPVTCISDKDLEWPAWNDERGTVADPGRSSDVE